MAIGRLGRGRSVALAIGAATMLVAPLFAMPVSAAARSAWPTTAPAISPGIDTARSSIAATGGTGSSQSAPASTDGAWGSLMDWGLQGKHMAALPTGKVLVWSTGATAAVWNPADGTLTAAPALFGDLHCAGESMLADGRVIVIGGQNGATHNGTSITSLFDPGSQTWTQGADMWTMRWYATSTTLADGRVLATSGDAPDGTRSTIPEVYDPIANTWTRLTGASRSQPLYPLMFVLPDTRVFEAGPGSATAILDATGTGHWTAGPTNAYATSGYSESAVMYAPGKIMRAGGGDPAINRVSVIDMTAATPVWRDVTPMAFPRRRMNLTILADGTIMAMGGTRAADDASQAVLESEIWNPSTETWTTVAPMAEPRMYHSAAVLLTDGRIVVGGGEAAGRLRAQVYSPPYLFQGARPVISAAPQEASYGTTFTVSTPDAAAITSVALIRLSAMTHAFDQNQRYVPLSFSTGSGSLTVAAPVGGGVAPPGPYQLVIKNGAGVPSAAKILRVDTIANLQPGSLVGTVTDSVTAAPLAGVTVTIAGQAPATTNSIGAYSIAGITAGEQTVRFAASGYADVVRTKSIVAGTANRLDVTMAPPGSIAGHVTDSVSGLPIGGATITYTGGDTTTDSTGAYSIAGIPAGSQTIAASAAAHTSLQQLANVPAGGTATLDFALAPAATYVTGAVYDLTTSQPISGAGVTIPGGGSTTTDSLGRYRIDVSPGTWSVTATAAGHDPQTYDAIVSAGTYAVQDFSLVATVVAPSTLTFEPTADAYVSQTSPTKNYDGTTFRIRNGTSASPGTYATYLRFTVAGLAGRTVTGASLKMYDTDASVDGGHVFATGNAWTETGVTWANAPVTVGPALGSAGRVAINAWATINLVPSAIGSDGTYSFVLNSASTDSAYYMSRTGVNRPVLTLTTGGGGPPPPPPPPTPPVAAFTLSPASVVVAAPVTVTDTSTGTPTTWAWDFGDGVGSALAAPPAHSYAIAGTYTITLTVSNTAGPSSTTRSVTVTAAPPPPPPPASSRLASLTFEDGRLVDPVSGASRTSGPVTLVTTGPLAGLTSARVATSADAYLERSFTAADDAYVVATVRFAVLPTAAVRVLQISDAGTTIGSLQIQINGALRLRNASTTIGADSAPLAAGVTYRIAIHQRRGTGANAVLEGFVAPAGTAFPAAFASASNGSWTTAADRLRIGATAGGILDLTMDDILVDGSSMPGLTVASASTAIATAIAAASAALASRPPWTRLAGAGASVSWVCLIG